MTLTVGHGKRKGTCQMNVKTICLVIGLLSVTYNLHGLTIPLGAETATATGARLNNHGVIKSSVGSALNHVHQAFDVPVSLEWSFVNEDRTEIQEQGSSAFRIREGDTLADVLDRVCAIEGGRLQWLRLRGNIVVCPVVGSGTTESTLDTMVSFEVQGVSTWEALCILARTVNDSKRTDRTLQIVPGFADGYEGPPQFSESKTISLNLKDVPARDVLLAIIEASPIYIRYDYQNLYRLQNRSNTRPSSHVTVYPFVAGVDPKSYPFLDRREYLDIWLKEINAQVQAVDSEHNK